MATSKREEQILLYLSKQTDFITSRDLAAVFDVSTKTIYRLIKKINDMSQDGVLVQSDLGRGYRLNYDHYINFQNRMIEAKQTNFSPKERRSRIMESLLLSSPNYLNITKLFEAYYLGDSVISTDIQLITQQLEIYDLKLERQDKRIAISGNEVNVRKAIKDTIEIFNVIDITDLKNNKDLNFNNNDVIFILDQLRYIEKSLEITIPYPYNINIFSHLYVLLNRTRNSAKLNFAQGIDKNELNKMKENFEIYKCIKEIISRTEFYLQSELMPIESYLLYQYIISSRMQSSINLISHFTPDVSEITNYYIQEMAHRLQIVIAGGTIFTDLANHIKPMINRLNHNIKVRNSLLNDIQLTYGDIYRNVKEVSTEVSDKFSLDTISDDEIGFISLYFAKIMETYVHQEPIRVVIMCTTGIGTSELLKAKISRSFSELDIVDVVSTNDVEQLELLDPKIDLILSTVNVSTDNTKVLIVSAMFTDTDKKRLRKVVGEIYDERY